MKGNKTMEKYNYFWAVVFDAKEWLLNNHTEKEILNCEDGEDFFNEMWTADSVTGNASGSYYCNRWKAEEAMCHNWSELAKVAENYGYDKVPREWLEEPETADVVMRCSVLYEAVEEALKELKEERKEE